MESRFVTLESLVSMLHDSNLIPFTVSTLPRPASIEVEEPFRLMVEAVADYAVFMLDAQGTVATWNLGAQRIKGYDAEEIIGRHFSTFYPPEAIASGLPQRELVMAASVGRYEDEGWRLRKDGTKFWANVVITALRAPGGELIGFVKITRDLTERRAAEESLQQAHDQQAQLAERLADAHSFLSNILNSSTMVSVISFNAMGIITLFNRGAERMLGYTPAEVIGKRTPMLFHKTIEIEEAAHRLYRRTGERTQGVGVLAALIGHEQQHQAEWSYIRKNGEEIKVSMSLSRVLDRDGELLAYLAVAEDITERLSSQQELAAAYSRLATVMDSTSEAVMQVSMDWTMLYGNRRTYEVLPHFQVGANLWEVYAALHDTPAGAHLRRAMVERVAVAYENYYEPFDQWFATNVFPTPDGLSIFYRDITAEKKMAEQLAVEQMLREKRIVGLSHMAGGLAHEISNPLAIIHAIASDLRHLAETRPEIPAAEVNGACDGIVQTSDRAMKILRGLRGFAREGSQDPVQPANLGAILDECVELQIGRFRSQDVALHLETERNLPLLECREIQISQIVTNLLNNAFDSITQSSCEERWVRVTATACGAMICVDVVDSGPGVEDRYKAHLMEPFFTTKKMGMGMGVGLSLSRAIAQEHGGTLTLCEGTLHTTFRLMLPTAQEARADAGEPQLGR